MTKKILFCSGGTGGHIFPSVALTNFFSKKNYETMLVTDKRGEQYIKNNSLFYKTIDVVSSSQSGFMYKIFFYFKLIQAFFNSISLLRTEKPDIILGLGGYVSFPICLAARLLNIKILLYESNAVLGRTNKIFVRFCKKIFTNSENIQKLSKKYSFKSVRVGNILREEIFRLKLPQKDYSSLEKKIVILGGSQGAKVFGELIPQVIVDLNKKYKISIVQQSLYSQVEEIKDFYNDNKIKNYVFSFEKNIIEFMSKAHLAISRCGSSTLGELEFLGVPFLAIPYPFAKDNHQYENANYYKKKGCCWVLNQTNLNFHSLKEILIKILDNNVELSLKRENMLKNDSKNTLSKIENEIKKLI